VSNRRRLSLTNVVLSDAQTVHNIFSYSFFKTGPFASPGIEAIIYTRTQSCGYAPTHGCDAQCGVFLTCVRVRACLRLPRPLCDVALILSTSLSLMPSDIASGPLDSSHYG
jgi:hypothetical protein